MVKVGSIYPYSVTEHKPGLFPSLYHLEGTKDDKHPTVLEVNDAHYWLVPDNGIPLKIPVPASELANSLVNDFISGCFGAFEGTYPGIYIIGDDAKSDLAKTQRAQNRWFKRLIEMADNDWALSNKPGSINRIQRHAARALGVEREWMMEASDTPKFCPACTRSVPALAVVCMNCQCVLDPDRFKTMQFANAQPVLQEKSA